MSEQMIYALSSLGQVSLAQFNEIFKQMYSPGNDFDEEKIEVNYRNQIVRVLDALGYCEFDYARRKVFMCPPALVTVPSFGLPKAILTGARTPKLVKRIKASVASRKEKAVFDRICQRKDFLNMPDVISVEACDESVLKEIADETGAKYDFANPVAWDLVNYSASISDIEKSLKFERLAEVDWKKRYFNKEKLIFSYYPDDSQKGLRLTEYINPVNHQKEHYLWDGDCAAESPRDWGRFICLKSAGKNILFYDIRTQCLGIPLTVPLPRILARAVALCSGLIPLIKTLPQQCGGHCPMQIYTDIPEVIAMLVSQKLGQKIMTAQIDLSN